MKNIVPALILIMLSACKFNNEDSDKKVNVPDNNTLIEVNKILVDKDNELILKYIERHNWKMEQTRTGLWYMIYKKGTGEKAVTGKNATIDYRIELLDGTLCYESDNSDPKTFRVGQGGVESGLEQGILLLREGDEAKFIMPPHLAHGLLGDENKIPPRAIIVYDVKLIDIQ